MDKKYKKKSSKKKNPSPFGLPHKSYVEWWNCKKILLKKQKNPIKSSELANPAIIDIRLR